MRLLGQLSGDEFLEVRNFEGRWGDERQLARKELGRLAVRRLIEMPGARDDHHLFQSSPSGKYSQDRWSEFVADVAKRGVLRPVFIVVEPISRPQGTRVIAAGPQISEGNHRVRAALDAGIPSIPVEIRYFGKAEERWEVAPEVRRFSPKS